MKRRIAHLIDFSEKNWCVFIYRVSQAFSSPLKNLTLMNNSEENNSETDEQTLRREIDVRQH